MRNAEQEEAAMVAAAVTSKIREVEAKGGRLVGCEFVLDEDDNPVMTYTLLMPTSANSIVVSIACCRQE